LTIRRRRNKVHNAEGDHEGATGTKGTPKQQDRTCKISKRRRFCSDLLRKSGSTPEVEDFGSALEK